MAEAIARASWIMFAGAAAVWLLMMTLLLAAMTRSRERPMRRPLRFIIVGGLIFPSTTLLALLVYGTGIGRQVVASHLPVDGVVEVVGHAWFWEFKHLDENGNALARSRDHLTLPVDRLIEFHVTSADVIHSFWIPRLGGKIDAIPGRVNSIRLKATRKGEMSGQCAEFCGLEHAHMQFPVVVAAQEEFDRWLADQANSGDQVTMP